MSPSMPALDRYARCSVFLRFQRKGSSLRRPLAVDRIQRLDLDGIAQRSSCTVRFHEGDVAGLAFCPRIGDGPADDEFLQGTTWSRSARCLGHRSCPARTTARIGVSVPHRI